MCRGSHTIIKDNSSMGKHWVMIESREIEQIKAARCATKKVYEWNIGQIAVNTSQKL